MEEQRAAARANAKFKMAAGLEYTGAETVFTGYESLEEKGAEVIALYVDGEQTEHADAGAECVVVFDRTPFYAESGGQVGDTGRAANDTTILNVMDTFRIKAAVTGHQCRVAEGGVSVGDKFDLRVDEERRAATQRNHSVTHLMHKALRTVLGDQVQQKGSLVTPEATRFDFSYSKPVTEAEIAEVERLVNAQILRNVDVVTQVLPIEEAKKTGAVMLFGERYGETVRVLTIGNAVEFCGGTHVARTGDIGFFKIVSEGGIAAGIRRIEAVTGMNALNWVQTQAGYLNETARYFKVPGSEVPKKVGDLISTVKTLEKGIDQLKSQMASKVGDQLVEQARDVAGVKLLVARMDGADAKALRETMDKVKDKLGSAVALLAAVGAEGRVQLAAGVTKDLIGRIKAGELVNFAAQQMGGKGGGKPDMAMAGAHDASNIDAVLASVEAWVAEKLA